MSNYDLSPETAALIEWADRAREAERKLAEARELLRHCLDHSREHLPRFLVPKIEAAIDALRREK